MNLCTIKLLSVRVKQEWIHNAQKAYISIKKISGVDKGRIKKKVENVETMDLKCLWSSYRWTKGGPFRGETCKRLRPAIKRGGGWRGNRREQNHGKKGDGSQAWGSTSPRGQ